MTRILRDLRRPAARDAARAALMAGLGSDLDTLNWTAGLVDSDSQWRLALHARPGISDADVVAAWRAEARADRADRAAAEAEAAAALRTSIGAANAAEDAADGGFAFRAPGF